MNPNMYMAWTMAPMNPAMYQPMTRMADPQYYIRRMNMANYFAPVPTADVAAVPAN